MNFFVGVDFLLFGNKKNPHYLVSDWSKEIDVGFLLDAFLFCIENTSARRFTWARSDLPAHFASLVGGAPEVKI